MLNFRRICLVLLFISAKIGAVQAQALPSFADLVEQLQPSVVNISTTRNEQDMNIAEDMEGISSSDSRMQDFFNPQGPKQVSLGSGFVIDKDGYIITNNHVIDKAKEITVTFADNTQLEAKLVGTDPKTDIALIKVASTKALPAVKFGNSDKIRVGDWILAIGNPFGLGGSVTAGIVSAKSRDIESGPYDNFIQTDASINQGSSGGPMFNLNGEVIGINTAIFSTSGGNIGIGFAVPIDLTTFVINELRSKGKVERGWIGIKIQPSSIDIASSLSQDKQIGVMVSSVSENSSAKKAGIEAGDIILSFDGQKIDNTKNFSRMVAETKVGKIAEVEIWRNKKSLKLKIPVLLMPQEEAPVVREIQSSLENNGSLDFAVADLGAETINKYNLNPNLKGVVVTSVVAGSDAENKGLREGNVITQIDKKTIFDTNDVKTYVEEAKQENHRPILLLINDNDVLHYVAVKLKPNE